MQMYFLPAALLFITVQQQPVPARAPQVTFRSGIDRVALDVIVIDDEGRPVADLTEADFTLEVDGRARSIASAEFVSLRRLADPGSPPAHYATNTDGSSGRLIALVIDQNNIAAGTGRLVFDAAARFVESLNPDDRIALHLIPGSGPVVDFTANHALVVEQLKRAVGRATSSITLNSRVGISEARAIVRGDAQALREVLDRECSGNLDPNERAVCQRLVVSDARMLSGAGRAQTAETLVSLREFMRSLVAGRARKTVVLLSEGLVLDQGIQDLGWVTPLASRGQISLFALQVDSHPFGAGSARVSPSLSEDRALGREGLSLLAGLTGGAVVPLTRSNPALGFGRVATELSGYYLISFEPTPAERDGQPHDIRVRARRDGLTIRTRRQFAMDAALAPGELEQRVVAALASPLDSTDLPLWVAPYVLGEAQGKVKVIIAAAVQPEAGARDAAYGYAVSDAQGRVAGTDLEPSLGPADGTSRRLASAVVVPPGLYSVRAAIADASGREGATGHTFDARLHAAGQVRWSDLVLSERLGETGNLALVIDDVSAPTLQAYLELYSDVVGALDGIDVAIEISRVEEGLSLVRGPLAFSAVQAPGRRAGEVSLDVALLGDGGFIARAILSKGGVEVGRVLRPFTIPKSR